VQEAPPPRLEEEVLPSPSQETSPRYRPAQEELGRRRSVSAPLPPTPPQPLFEEEEPLAEEEHAFPPEMEEMEEEEAAHLAAFAEAEAELAPPVLYIEIPGEEAVAMEGDECIIGRGKSCHFVIDSNRVSRQHARIVRDGHSFILEDLNSSNGTFYGKHREKVTRRTVADGDEFIFGTERVTFFLQ